MRLFVGSFQYANATLRNYYYYYYYSSFVDDFLLFLPFGFREGICRRPTFTINKAQTRNLLSNHSKKYVGDAKTLSAPWADCWHCSRCCLLFGCFCCKTPPFTLQLKHIRNSKHNCAVTPPEPFQSRSWIRRDGDIPRRKKDWLLPLIKGKR